MAHPRGARLDEGPAALTTDFAALGALPLAIVNAVSQLRPVRTMVLAIALLGERVPRARWLAASGILVVLCVSGRTPKVRSLL